MDGAGACFGAARDAIGVGEGLLDLYQGCLAGVGETAAGAGDVATVVAEAVSFFLYWRLATLAEGDGETAAGDVATAVAGAVSFFVCLRLATLADGDALAEGDGDWASSEVAENPIKVISRPINLFIPRH